MKKKFALGVFWNVLIVISRVVIVSLYFLIEARLIKYFHCSIIFFCI